MKWLFAFVGWVFLSTSSIAANVVPTDIQMPGTQPGEISEIDVAEQCEFCHGGYDKVTEPWYNWQGSMMSHASRDPIFWAQLAVVEQDFDGAGDLCIRCHMQGGWLAGRSVPTDGTSLLERDKNGIQCDFCHRLTNPDQSEHLGIQNSPFIAKTGREGHYGAGQYVLFPGVKKLGPYSDAEARHPNLKSSYHRSVDFCGTCHDVSNPAVGDLAPNHGAQIPLPAGSFSGSPGTPVTGKAAFNNPPYAYGIVERTYSEYKASAFPTTRVSDFNKLPAELQVASGSIAIAKAKAENGGLNPNGNYSDGTVRYFSCQTCHLPPTQGTAVATSRIHNKPKKRTDMPSHDLTGGNYWVPEAIKYLDSKGKLRIGGGLTASQKQAMTDGSNRARDNLDASAYLQLLPNNQLKITNLTGHKLISGYPEGRRMWLNIKWYRGTRLIKEEGKYGAITMSMDFGSFFSFFNPQAINSIVDIETARIYEAHGAITQPWAQKLIDMGRPANLPLSFDRSSGRVTMTLGQLAASPPDTYHETFHFVLNNYVSKDNRIPPYQMRYDEARKRNALPVPETQYGNPGPGGMYDHFDIVQLNPPSSLFGTATRAEIRLMYQPTSWEYIQFLALANEKTNSSLLNEGDNLLDAWLATGQAAPHEMAMIPWSAN